jgi:hypothetical protein
VQDIGVGELGGQGGSSDVACQRRQGAPERIGSEIFVGEVGVDRAADRRVGGAERPEQSVAGADHFREELLLGSEVGIEGAARQAGRQHDVVDAGPGVAAQPEQPAGMLEDLGPDSGGMGGAWRHDMPINI